jgi:anti-anti-sigma factor
MEDLGDNRSATVTVLGDGSDILRLSIAGELDLASVESIHEAIDQVLSPDPLPVVFDLGGLTFMDSSGIAMMLQISKRVSTIEVRNVTPIVRRVIEATGLVEVLGLEP